MAKKDKAPKLPKKVGGVKVPKQLRKTAKSALEIAQNPIARELVSAAMAAGAAALAKRKITEKNAAAEASKPNSEFNALIAQSQEIGNMISQGINSFVNALLKPADKPTTDAKPAAAKPAARKPASAKRAPAKAATKAAATTRVTTRSAATKTATAKPAAVKPAAARRTPAAKPRSKPAPKPTQS